MPAIALAMSSGQVRALNEEFEDDIGALNAFNGRSTVDRFTMPSIEKPRPWTLYGRLGVFNFQNELEPQRSEGVRFSFKRTGPKLTGRIYVGIHRQF